MSYQTCSTIRNGEIVDIHRCSECHRMMVRATGQHQTDNGWTLASQPLSHLPGCTHYRNGTTRGTRHAQ